MNTTLLLAAVGLALVGLAHSVLGEILVFKPLRVQGWVPTAGAPVLRERHIRILRGSWHLVTLLGWALSALLAAGHIAIGCGTGVVGHRCGGHGHAGQRGAGVRGHTGQPPCMVRADVDCSAGVVGLNGQPALHIWTAALPGLKCEKNHGAPSARLPAKHNFTRLRNSTTPA